MTHIVYLVQCLINSDEAGRFQAFKDWLSVVQNASYLPTHIPMKPLTPYPLLNSFMRYNSRTVDPEQCGA